VADLNDILTDLRAELVAKVLQIAVKERGMGERSFDYHLPTKGKFEEVAGKPRLFVVRLSSCESKWCGNGLARYDVVFDIIIGYPLHDWEIAMASDYDQLRTAINASGAASSVTGCGFRHLPLGGYKTAPGDDWQWATFPVNAVVETA
jgi:hypothetical protein